MRVGCIGLALLMGLAGPACSKSTDVNDDPIVKPDSSLPRPALELVPCTEKSFLPSIAADWEDVDCAFLSVPEDRTNSSGRFLRLPVVLLRSMSSTPVTDPIVYLSGGPGDRSTDSAARFIANGRGGRHDLVLLDQRGTGRASPNLNCPEVERVIWANFETTDGASQEGDRMSAAHAACRTRLDPLAALDHYRSTDSAHDVSDLREAMGVGQVNLLAESYGTAVALEVLRLHPGAVRAVVLDSVVPPWRDGTPAPAADRVDNALARFIDGCTSDPACRAAHPDLDEALIDVRERFDESPHRVEFQDSGNEARTANLTGSDVLRGIVQALYDPSLIPLLPGFIEQLRTGTTAVLDAVGASLLGTAADQPEGLVASVTCAERGSKRDPDELRRVAQEHRLSGPLLTPPICDAWDVPPVTRSFRIVGRTKIPTLVLAGQFDPVTPPSEARDVETMLGPLSTFIEFPGLGHGVLSGGACPSDVIERFMDAPLDSVDTSCVRSLPAPAWAG